jgi:AraC family transcriptional regulator of arabinose operon
MEYTANYIGNLAMQSSAGIRRYRESFAGHRYEYDRVDPPIKVTGAVLTRWGPGGNFTRTNRRNVSLSLVTMGNARYEQDGRTGEVAPGELFFAHRGSNQRFEPGSAGFLHKRSLILEGPELDAVIASVGLVGVDRIRPRDRRYMTGLFRHTYRILRARPPRLGIELSKTAWEILMLCAEGTVTEFPPTLARAVEYTKRNVHVPLRIDDIAAAAGVSVRHCTRLFREHLNCSPIAFYLQQKMAVAENMVASTTQSGTQIAAALGYDDPLYFSVQFKKFHGMSPRNYRRERARSSD